MKDQASVYREMTTHFRVQSGIDIQEGTVMDLYTLSISDSLEKAYKEIENNRNPHIFSRLRGQELDDTGWFLNMPRRENEEDMTYLYRQMNWLQDKQRTNLTAINNALLNMEHASDALFIPRTNGSGTGTVYIIPINYTDAQKELAINEAKQRLYDVASPTAYIEYVVPRALNVVLHAYMDAGSADAALLQSAITEKIREYIHAIAPGDKLQVGAINRIGVNEPSVAYFNIMQTLIDGIVTPLIEIEQEVHTKLFLGKIIWNIEE